MGRSIATLGLVFVLGFAHADEFKNVSADIAKYDSATFHAEKEAALARVSKAVADYVQRVGVKTAQKEIGRSQGGVLAKMFLLRVADTGTTEARLMAYHGLSEVRQDGVRRGVVQLLRAEGLGDRYINYGLAAIRNQAYYEPASADYRDQLKVLTPLLDRSNDAKYRAEVYRAMNAVTAGSGDALQREVFAATDESVDYRLRVLEAVNSTDSVTHRPVDRGVLNDAPPGHQVHDKLYLKLLDDANAPVELRKRALAYLGTSPSPEVIQRLIKESETGPFRAEAADSLGRAVAGYHDRAPTFRVIDDITDSYYQDAGLTPNVVRKTLEIYENAVAAGADDPVQSQIAEKLRAHMGTKGFAQMVIRSYNAHSGDADMLGRLRRTHGSTELLATLTRMSEVGGGGGPDAALVAIELSDNSSPEMLDRLASRITRFMNYDHYIGVLEARGHISDVYLERLLANSHPYSNYSAVNGSLAALQRIRDQLGPEEFYRRVQAITRQPSSWSRLDVEFGILNFARQADELSRLPSDFRISSLERLRSEIARPWDEARYGTYTNHEAGRFLNVVTQSLVGDAIAGSGAGPCLGDSTRAALQ